MTLPPATPEQPIEELTFVLDWAPYAVHAMFWPAVDNGYFEENYLSVDIVRGFGSGDTVGRVEIGTADFGFADFGEVVMSRSTGSKVKEVAMIYHDAPFGLQYIKGMGISEPEDLEGKTIGTVVDNADWVLFKAILRDQGIDVDSINEVYMDPALHKVALLSGQVDFIALYSSEVPSMEIEAEKQGDEIGTFLFGDLGTPVYANGIIVSETMIEEKPDVISRFLDALYKSVQWTLDNREEAVNIFVTHNPELEAATILEGLDLEIESLQSRIDAGATGIQLGLMNEASVQNTIDLIAEIFDLENVPAASDVYTNQFIVG